MDDGQTIERLGRRLDLLRRRDTARRVFGASAHNYETRPAAVSEVSALEDKIGVGLPKQYRQWLLKVGWGAGPYYGLLSPREIMRQLYPEQDMRKIFDEEVGIGWDVADAASITASDFVRYWEDVRRNDTRAGVRITAKSFRGAIPVNHQGCNGYSHLLIAGEFQGAILGECSDLIGEPWTAEAAFWPEGQEHLERPCSFFEWMDEWLSGALRTFGIQSI